MADNDNQPIPARRSGRVRTIVLRTVGVAAALGLWFWTQSLIGARGFPQGCVGDGLHELTGGVNRWLAEVPDRGDWLLVLSSLVIDAVGIFLLARSIFGGWRLREP